MVLRGCLGLAACHRVLAQQSAECILSQPALQCEAVLPKMAGVPTAAPTAAPAGTTSAAVRGAVPTLAAVAAALLALLSM